MQTQTFYRKANVASAEAIASIKRTFPKSELVDFQKKVAEDAGEAAAANAKVGDEIYVASIKKSEFPPKEVGGGEEAPESDSEDSAPESSDSDDEGSDSEEASDPFGSEDSPEEPEEEKLSPEEETVSLLKQILQAVKGGGLGDDPLGPPEGDLGLPDVGAPEPGLGGGLPPPGGKPPLPPPIREKKPVGGPAFASFDANADEVFVIRNDVEDNLTIAKLKEEAEYNWPTHKVATVRWAGTRDDKKAEVKLVKR